jgi:heme a synthase
LFISTKYRSSYHLALIACVLAFFVIMLGAYTRLTDAGLSCPDWPNCYGYLTAPHTAEQLQGAAQKYPSLPINVKKAWTEMTHRYFAGTEGILILILSGTFLFSRKIRNKRSVFAGVSLLGLLGLQVTLGMLTVTELLKPVIVLSHLLTGLSLLCLLWWAYLDFFVPRNTFANTTPATFKPWLWLAFIIMAAQITLGGWVSTHYAGLACIDFPYCNGKVLPTLQWAQFNTDLITIHMLHRIGALITGCYLVLLSLTLLRQPTLRAMGVAIMTLVTLQITLGILNIMWLRPVWLALIHHGVAIILLLTIIAALVKATKTATDNRHA